MVWGEEQVAKQAPLGGQPTEFDRTDAALARKIIEGLVPDERTRRALLEIVATSIEAAHAVNPRSWELSLAQNAQYICLNVGRIFMCTVKAKTVSISLEWPDETKSDLLADLKAQGRTTFVSVKDVTWLEYPHGRFLELWPTIQPLHRAALERAAKSAKQTPFAWAHSSGATAYIGTALGKTLPTPDYSETDTGRIDKFLELFTEFGADYFRTETGQQHLAKYAEVRESGRNNYEAVLEAVARGDDVTDLALRILFPHGDNEGSRRKGAWIHIAPMALGDLKAALEGKGIVAPGDWPDATRTILDFIRHSNEKPAELADACREFAASRFSKGIQSALLSPILNALRPDDFLIINKKSRELINWMSGTGLTRSIEEYPRLNELGKALIDKYGQEMQTIAESDARPADLFDEFSHWLVAIKGFDFDAKTRFWKIAPGDNASLWEQCKRDGYISLGWEEMGDLSGLERAEFNSRRDALIESKGPSRGWTANALNQLWSFRSISVGDRVVANRGTSEVLGIGTAVGTYYFIPDVHHGHRIKVRWDDTRPRPVSQLGWRRTLVELDEPTFRAIAGKLPTLIGPLTPETFALLEGLKATPTAEYYQAHKGEFAAIVEEPLRAILGATVKLLPDQVLAAMETDKNLFGRILKNDYGRGGAWPFYWGALYPKGGTRTGDAQLFVSLEPRGFVIGFSVGDYSGPQKNRLAKNLRLHGTRLVEMLRYSWKPMRFVFGHESSARLVIESSNSSLSLDEWLENPEKNGLRVATIRTPEETSGRSVEALSGDVAEAFTALFPLVLLATKDDPMPEIERYISGVVPKPDLPTQPAYPLDKFSADTGMPVATLVRWIKAIERKGQAVLYGPPGTGKTFVAERLARHLIGGGKGFAELIQFHPAYAYEDFIQGIRPKAAEDGQLTYKMVRGRFLEFCDRAREVQDPCVLIIDEINRANLARVFGELMYLLEYRNHEVPLAGGGTLKIPTNVRLIGTMNTADRSIALVDHALRRRFAFLHLRPNPEVLRKYHDTHATGFEPAGLIEVLTLVNSQISDPHYEVGVSFFLLENLAEQIEDIWTMEIEPYLEEYFFDQAEKVEALRWDKVQGKILR